jgi:membrane protein
MPLQVVDIVISLAIFTLVFASVFKIVPDVVIAWRDTWIGAAITAALFVGGKFAIGQYLGISGVGSAYGAAGSLIVLLVWVYYSSLILFFGAEVTQQYAIRFGARLRPSKYARWTDDAPAADRPIAT